MNKMYKSATPMKPNRYTTARLIKTVMGTDGYCFIMVMAKQNNYYAKLEKRG